MRRDGGILTPLGSENAQSDALMGRKRGVGRHFTGRQVVGVRQSRQGRSFPRGDRGSQVGVPYTIEVKSPDPNCVTTHMKLAFSTNAYLKFSFPETVRRLARIGYTGVEIMADVPHAWPAYMFDEQKPLTRMCVRAASVGRLAEVW